MWSKYTRDLDDKYGWNDPFLTSRTLSQHESVIGSNRKGTGLIPRHRYTFRQETIPPGRTDTVSFWKTSNLGIGLWTEWSGFRMNCPS